MRSLLTLLVEPTMYFAVGFLLAALLSLPFLGVAHRRAERLTKQRLNSLLPMSVKELQAEKDLLRAEFAASAQRFASTVEDMRAKTAVQQAEIGRQGGTVATLKSELGEKAKTIGALEAREAALKQKLRATEQEHALKSVNLEDARRALLDKEAELARLAADLGTRAVIADQQNVELAKARANVAALKAAVQDQNREVETLNTLLVRQREEIEAASRQVADERGKVENLGRRIADLEIELIAQRNAAEALSRVTADRFCDQARLLAAREYEADRLQVALDGARRTEASLRSELTQIEERHAAEAKAALAEKAEHEIQIAQLQLDRQQLQWELAALRRAADESHAAEQVESAMMRKRINEVVDQVALLRSALQAPAAPPPPEGDIRVAANGSHNGAPVNGSRNGAPVNGSLNGHAMNGHAAPTESPFKALDEIFVHELRGGEQTAAPRPVAN